MQLFCSILRHNYSTKLEVTQEQLIKKCQQNDDEARRELYLRYGKIMYGVCCRYIKDRVEAEDVLHDGFITLFTKIKLYRFEGSFEGWCRRIFINTALTHLREKNPLLDASNVDEQNSLSNKEASVVDQISAQDLTNIIDKLPEGYKTIINLYAVEGYSHKEIGEMLDISENTSRSQYSRARAKLSQLLLDYEK
ncbi:MAG: sigma-70 family RNA polymerase sigma factor [Rikenellaceae bacterium]